MIARAFRDIGPLVMLLKFSNCTRLRTSKASIMPLYHEMHERSYDFLYMSS